VKVSQNSAKGNEVAGEYIMQKALLVKNKATRDSLLRGSIAYQQKAIQIYPKQIIALFNLAAAYYEYNKDYDTILVVYKTILNYLPGNERIYSFFNSIMGKYGNVDHKIRLYQDLLQVNPQRFDVNLNLGFLYFSGKLDAVKALPLFEKAVKLNPADFNGQEYLGTAYGYLRRWNEARKHLELADSIKPGDPEVNKNLSIVYQNLGEHHKARQPVTKTEKGQ
jgi:tetratricopeptide (TPR) repeat protein